MKISFLFSLIIASNFAFSQLVDTAIVTIGKNTFYHIKSDQNSNVLIFLHGGVSNPRFANTTNIAGLHFLLEANQTFVASSLSNGFDLFIPVTNDSLNWVTNSQYCFDVFVHYLETSKSYTSKLISGFSDGGTGSYKMFYDNWGYFDGLVVFNGYPQHNNFYRKVEYQNVTDKKVIFFSTFDDEIIPYEFLLTEYCRQKEWNANTYLYVKQGRHSFFEYEQKEMDICFDVLTAKVNNRKKKVIHAFVKDDKVVEFYPFRKKIFKKFGYGEEYYQTNQKQGKSYKKK